MDARGIASHRLASAKIHWREGLTYCTPARPFLRRFISRPRKLRRCAGFIIRFNSVLEGYWSVQTWSVTRDVEKSSCSLSTSLYLSCPIRRSFRFTLGDRSKNLIYRERAKRPLSVFLSFSSVIDNDRWFSAPRPSRSRNDHKVITIFIICTDA